MTDNFSSNGFNSTTTALSDMSGPTSSIQVQLAPQPAPVSPLTLLRRLETELNAVLIERNDAVRAALVALVAGQNMALLGPPGCGKSLVVTELARRIRDNNPAGAGGGLSCFTLLMTKYTDPDEVFGPVSLTALKNDQRKRTTTHKLPETHFAFLDEVFKAN